MAVLGPCINVNMNGHNIHNQLTKSLERILEDAYLSGELKLSGRKLKEFPKPVNFDLCDTVLADLSKNRFADVPEELTGYVYLERLLLAQNVIRHVPDAIGALQSLTYLDLSCNQLTELPREICQMPLEVLLLFDNELRSLPKEIGKMTSLAELDVSRNRLTQVPMTIGDCTGLKALNLSNNQLGLLPLQVTYLQLELLDISCNSISSLPLELRNMHSLVELAVDNNPLVSPPTTVCMRGRVHIFKYLENVATKDSVPGHRRLEDARRLAKHTSYLGPALPGTGAGAGAHVVSGNATIDCLRRRHVDSGYCTSDGDKRWSNDGGGDGSGVNSVEGGSGRSTPSTPSTLSPHTALSRAQSLTGESPLTPSLAGLRISPEGLNGDDKSKIGTQQTYRQYKEYLRQQRHQDPYRYRNEQSSSPDLDSPQSQNQSPVHNPLLPLSTPHSPISNGHYTVNSYYKTNATYTPNSPLLHSTPRRYQANLTNGNVSEPILPKEDTQNKRPVQKVVPSRNINKMYMNGERNSPTKESNVQDMYIKPTSPTKSPTHTLPKTGIPRMNGTEGPKLLTTSVSYLKGTGRPSPSPRLNWNKDVPPESLSFTMKREFDKQKEETELLQQLRTIIEGRLKMSLPVELAPVLADGVVLCHLANHVRPRSVASVHVPSPAQPKLTMARCRRNVDNFLEACRKIGVEEEDICSADDILSHHPDVREGWTDIGPLARSIQALLSLANGTAKDFGRCHNDIQMNFHQQRHTEDMFERHTENGHYIEANNYTHEVYTRESFCQENGNAYEKCEEIRKEHTNQQVNTCHIDYFHNQFRFRYAEDRLISNFNTYNNEAYTIDEADEYQLLHESNPSEVCDVITEDKFRNRIQPSHVDNRVNYVTPIYKSFPDENFEIHDMDEVDYVMEPGNFAEENFVRYDRSSMTLPLRNNLNADLDAVAVRKVNDEDRFKVTCLCLGSFLLAFILLVIYPV